MIHPGTQKLIDDRITGVKRKCPLCAKENYAWYLERQDGKKVLAMFCPCKKPLTKFIKNEEGLPIPIFKAKILQRKEREIIRKEEKNKSL